MDWAHRIRIHSPLAQPEDYLHPHWRLAKCSRYRSYCRPDLDSGTRHNQPELRRRMGLEEGLAQELDMDLVQEQDTEQGPRYLVQDSRRVLLGEAEEAAQGSYSG